MTYLIGDRLISFNGATLSSEEQRIVKAHPGIFRACLNSTTHQYLLSTKKIVHLYTDIVTIYSTLLSKVPNYEDVRAMATKTRIALAQVEMDLNTVFGPDVAALSVGWEQQNYESGVKKMALAVLQLCVDAFGAAYRTLSCIDVFFRSFDNLKKLLVPFLLTHTRMVQRLLSGTMGFLRLQTIVDQVPMLPELTPTVIKQLLKIDSLTCGIERETRLLEMVFATVNPSLLQYTAVLLGRAILKREVEDQSCQLVSRREICYQAAEHVVSIPLTGTPAASRFVYKFTRHIFYFFSAILVVVVAVLYRLYHVIFG